MCVFACARVRVCPRVCVSVLDSVGVLRMRCVDALPFSRCLQVASGADAAITSADGETLLDLCGKDVLERAGIATSA